MTCLYTIRVDSRRGIVSVELFSGAGELIEEFDGYDAETAMSRLGKRLDKPEEDQ